MSSPQFLEHEWFEELNQRLSFVEMDSELASQRASAKVVFEIADSPRASAHAMTFTLDERGARLEPIDDVGADLVVTISFDDASRILAGDLLSSQALREGRLKIRGDVNALINFSSWMSLAHRARSARAE